MADKFPLGALMEKGLQIRTGQTHMQRYGKQLLGLIMEDEIDKAFLISRRLAQEQAPTAYRTFLNNPNEWTKVLTP